MNTRLMKLMALTLALVLMLSGCSLIKVDKEKDAQQVVAEFDGGTILKADAMARYQEVEDYYASYGEVLNDEQTIQSIKQDILTIMCEEAVVRVKADELGLTTLTDDEKTDLTVEATASFEEALSYYMVYFDEGSDEANREAALEYLTQQGFSVEGEIEYALEYAWQEKMVNEVTKDVVATEEDMQSAYADMLAADQEAFAESPYDFEYAVTSGETVTWMPEGYRTVKHILIPFTDDQIIELDNLLMELEDVR